MILINLSVLNTIHPKDTPLRHFDVVWPTPEYDQSVPQENKAAMMQSKKDGYKPVSIDSNALGTDGVDLMNHRPVLFLQRPYPMLLISKNSLAR